jgi:hypothetical protein
MYYELLGSLETECTKKRLYIRIEKKTQFSLHDPQRDHEVLQIGDQNLYK